MKNTTEPDTRCRARVKEGECHVRSKKAGILASVSGMSGKNKITGPRGHHAGELPAVLSEVQVCNTDQLRKTEYGVERRARRINAEPAT